MREEITTTLDNLVLICANCHRMLHRDLKVSIKELKEIIKE